MRKKVLTGIMILAMTMSICMAAVAAENPSATKNSLHSSGSIHYSQGEDSVIIDSADLYTLADQLDLFKVRVAEQLEDMDTYLTKAGGGVPLTSADGVCVVHNCPADGNMADPLSLDFAAVLEGVAASQSIPTDPESYGMSSSASLYKTWDGRLTTIASEGVEDVSIQAATADNLSAGAAAWVNGRLLLGTGADVADASGGDEEIAQYNISSAYTMPKNTATAFAFVYTTGSGNNNAASTPSFSVNGGGSYEKIYNMSYGQSGYNVKVALYHLKNISKGTVVKGSNGTLFY